MEKKQGEHASNSASQPGADDAGAKPQTPDSAAQGSGTELSDDHLDKVSGGFEMNKHLSKH